MTAAEHIAQEGRLPPVIGTASGGRFHVLDPRVSEVRIEDIAHHLSLICRYTGATSALWSVAAHCLEVSRRVQEHFGGSVYEQLCGLLHDASEAYLVDVPSPFKPDVVIDGELYRGVERRVQVTIFHAVGLPYREPPIVKQVDAEMIYDEVANFFSPGFMWERYAINRPKHNLMPLPPFIAKDNYLQRFTELRDAYRRTL